MGGCPREYRNGIHWREVRDVEGELVAALKQRTLILGSAASAAHVHQFMDLYGVWVCACGLRAGGWILPILESRVWPVLPDRIAVYPLDDRRISIDFGFGFGDPPDDG